MNEVHDKIDVLESQLNAGDSLSLEQQMQLVYVARHATWLTNSIYNNQKFSADASSLRGELLDLK